MQPIVRTGTSVLVAGALLLVAPCARADDDEPVVVDRSRTSRQLEQLPRGKGQPPVVTIYEFRSSVSEISARGATDMFTTALVKSGAFTVAERARLQEGVMREKQMNAAGQTTGTTGTQKMAAAAYVFEGSITEFNDSETGRERGFSLGGMQIGTKKQTASIGLDVRVVEVDSGLVIDSINVRKRLSSSQSSVSGIGSLAKSVKGLATGDSSIPLDPDVSRSDSRRDSVDRALRACIETTVLELVKRHGAK